MIEIRLARPSDVPQIEQLYAEAGYGGGIGADDYAMVALSGENIIGAVRLCSENGVTVLRGMQIKLAFQRQGLGARLLEACGAHLDENMAFCLPYSHLAEFYGLASFETVDASELPEFLAVRLASYLDRGQDVIAMRRRPKQKAMHPFRIEPLQEVHFERLHNLFDSICRERRFLTFTEAAPKEQTFEYYGRVFSAGHVHLVAMRDDEVLGWCDILPLAGQMRSHVGILGIGIAASERGKGLGRKLILAAIAKATERGLTRIELTVQSENHPARALYRSVGFVHEGTQRCGWRLDGQYFDVDHMARCSDAYGPLPD